MSYRAPELLKEDMKFNNKTDIWAFGCIYYEVATGFKLFPNDNMVLHYSTTKELDWPVPWPVSGELFRGLPVDQFINLHTEMLCLDPSGRPSTEKLLQTLFALHNHPWPGQRFRYCPRAFVGNAGVSA